MENTQNNKEITLDDLAVMVKKGFDETNGRIDTLDGRIDNLEKKVDEGFFNVNGRIDRLDKKVDDGFLNVNVRLDRIEKDIKHFVTQDEFDDLMSRVKYLEAKLGIESGK